MMNNTAVKRKHPDKGSSDRDQAGPSGTKRRCEKLSSYIEELYELITASLSNPESLNMKPDECTSLKDTLDQIKCIKQQQDAEHGGVPSGDSLGSNLLETLDGFLFVVNSQGEFEYVTENVSKYLKYQQEDLIGTSIYNYVHVGDRHLIFQCLRPSTTPTTSIWPSDTGNHSFKCRMRVKPNNEETPGAERLMYDTMMCLAILKPAINKDSNSANNDSEGTVHLFCIARRASPEEHSTITESVEEFTTKLNHDYVIKSVDMSGVKPPYYGQGLLYESILKFCRSDHMTELKKHLDEAKEKGKSSTPIYEFKLDEVTWMKVQTSCCISQHHPSDQMIVCVHTVMRPSIPQGGRGTKSTQQSQSAARKASHSATPNKTRTSTPNRPQSANTKKNESTILARRALPETSNNTSAESSPTLATK